MINYYMPDFIGNAGAICFFADLQKERPHWFYDNVKISAAYGSFGSCIWNGGRTFFDKNEATEMERLIEEYNKRDIAVRFTFTNPLLEEKHVYDTFGNLCLQLTNNGKNEVIVNSPILEDYIRANYPNFKLISSTTKCIKTIEGLKEELKRDYYLVVADSALNNTDALFALEDKSRVELIVNHGCVDDCPRRVAHYEDIGRSALSFRTSRFICPNLGMTFEDMQKRKNFITIDMIQGKYTEAGFQHFKLDGRHFDSKKKIQNFVYYLIKPEYKERVQEYLCRHIYQIESF